MSANTAKKVCTGDGRCLTRRDEGYVVDSKTWTCKHACVEQTCPNGVVCGKRAPAWYFARYHGLCQTCLELFGRRLTLKQTASSKTSDDTSDDVLCPVCYESCEVLVEFPTDCSHFFCGACSAKLLFYDETRYHLSPVPFGCAPCPNGCENPTRGRQCTCAEYDEVMQEWEDEYPNEWLTWTNAELDSIEDGDDTSSFGSRKCPLCRERTNF